MSLPRRRNRPHTSSVELADKRYRADEGSYLTLLETQRNLLSIERRSVQLRGSWAMRTAGLVRALGGVQ